jgi:hypothetical protein
MQARLGDGAGELQLMSAIVRESHYGAAFEVMNEVPVQNKTVRRLGSGGTMNKRMFSRIALVLLTGMLDTLTAWSQTGPYLGQTPPGMEAKLFAPGIVNTGMFTRDIAMTPDGNEIYFSIIVGPNKLATIACTKRIDGRWTAPEVVPQLGLAKYSSVEPAISPDGKRFYFSSNRPVAGKKQSVNDYDIWMMERQGDHWGEPVNLGEPINTPNGEYFPSVTRDGTLYFTAPDPAKKQEYIWRARLRNGHYEKPEKLPPQVNAGKARYNAFVAPDGSYLIVPIYGMPDSRGGTNYYVTFHNADDSWTAPRNLGDAVNINDDNQYSASVSPDGKYLFFISGRMPSPEEMPSPLTFAYLQYMHNTAPNGDAAIYWVDAKVITDLRPATAK